MSDNLIMPTNPLFIDLTDKVFNRLTVLNYAGRSGKTHAWKCVCLCGNIVTVRSSNLKLGLIKSCGCYNKERSTTHGMCETTEYRAWANMKDRCNNINCRSYIDYGGRGLDYCEQWADFKTFFFDMGKKPTPEHSLERIDNDSGYYPENCIWATKKEQTRNRRTNERVIADRKKYKRG